MAIVALPAARPRSGRCSAPRSRRAARRRSLRPTAGTRRRRRCSAASASSPGFSAGLWLAAAAARSSRRRRSRHLRAAARSSSSAGLVDDLLRPEPAREARRADRRRGDRARDRDAACSSSATSGSATRSRSSGWSASTNAFNLLDNMDGLAATLAAIAFGFFAIDAVTVHPSHADPRVRARRRARVRRLPAVQPAAATGARSSSWATRAAQALGFALAALGLAVELARRRDDGRDARAADPRPRRADPRHGARHGRAAARGPADLPGRPRPHLAPARPLRPLRAARGRAARADRDRHRRLEPRLQRARQRRATRSSASSSPSRCSCSSRASSPTSSGGRSARGEPVGLAQAFAVHWRRLVEVLVDFVVITGSFVAAYAIAFGWPGTTSQRYIARPDAADRARGALPRLHPLRPLPLGLALRRRARRGRDRRRGRRLRGRRARRSWC